MQLPTAVGSTGSENNNPLINERNRKGPTKHESYQSFYSNTKRSSKIVHSFWYSILEVVELLRKTDCPYLVCRSGLWYIVQPGCKGIIRIDDLNRDPKVWFTECQSCYRRAGFKGIEDQN